MADRLRAAARARGIDLQVVYTAHPGHAVALARDLDVDLVLAVGGDGTVSDVVTGAIGSHVPVGIIPVGSTNVVARDLGIPRGLDRAIAIALGDGVPVEVDVARAAGTTFLHMAGAGFDAAIFQSTDPRWKRRVGWLAYLPPAIRHLRYPAFTLELEVDGNTRQTGARIVLCALGSSVVAPRFRVGVDISRTDGLVDVCVYDPPSLLATLTCLAWIGLGRPDRSRWQRQFRGRRVRLTSNVTVPFEIDGDLAGTLPVDIEVLEQGVRVLIPPGRSNDLSR